MKEEKQHRYKVLTVLILAFLLTGTLLTYHVQSATPSTTGTAASPASEKDHSQPPSEPLVNRVVRVAIYNETNTTVPSYASGSGITSANLHNNVTQLAAMLNANGVNTTFLTASDISNHKLMTAQYDVLALVDNLPRENITNYVLEYWLDGGTILAFGCSGIYLCYKGILPPNAKGSTGHPTYWTLTSQGFNVTTRDPVSKAYTVGQSIETPGSDYLGWNWANLQASAIGENLTRVACSNSSLGTASVLAFDPPDEGGRVVTFAYDYLNGSIPALNQMIVGAVNWLCPHPKARILFDLTHHPYDGIDPWDTLATTHPAYAQWRNELVNRSYTLDKLYPSAAGNLTTANLAPYNMLVIDGPGLNFTASEVTAVTNWVNNGGGLFVLGVASETPSDIASNKYLNYLMSNLNLTLENKHYGTTWTTFPQSVVQQTTEGCSNGLYIGAYTYVNFTSPAFGIWNTTKSTNWVVGGQTYGSGRVILASNWGWIYSTSGLGMESNLQFAVNVANWLTSGKASVLVYVDTGGLGMDTNWNLYRGPVAQALDDLGIPFYLTFTGEYFNISLTRSPWTLVVVDNIENVMYGYFKNILSYMEAGGHLVMSSYEYKYAPASALYPYLGFNYTGHFGVPLHPIYIWNLSSDIFSQPNHYGASSFYKGPGYGTTCSNFTLLANGTSVAGLSAHPSTANASIVLGAGGRSITNAMCLTMYSGDTDNSTYADCFEIWENEIAYMIRPQCTLTPSVPASANEGTMLTISANATSFGLSAAMAGTVTLSLPSGFGTLSGSATQSLTSPLNPGTNGTATWNVNATGVGSYDLGFTAVYKGYKNTTYTATSTASVLVTGVFVFIPAFSPNATVTKGTTIKVNVTVENRGGTALTDATITAKLNGTAVTFTNLGSGVYNASISTSSLNVGNYSLVVNASKTGYTTYVATYPIKVKATTSAGFDPMLVVMIGEVVVAVALVGLLVTSLRKGGSKSGKRSK